MAGDVLRGDAAGALGEGGAVSGSFVFRKLALGIGEQVGAIAFEDEHEQQFGVQARRWNVGRGEAGDRRGERGS